MVRAYRAVQKSKFASYQDVAEDGNDHMFSLGIVLNTVCACPTAEKPRKVAIFSPQLSMGLNDIR
jgi:hypothetical protein